MSVWTFLRWNNSQPDPVQDHHPPRWSLAGAAAIHLLSDRKANNRRGRFGPLPGMSNRSKAARYSITSSAVASRPEETARPSALAVFRLMTKSNFCRPQHWQVLRFGTFEDAGCVVANLAVRFSEVGFVADQVTFKRVPIVAQVPRSSTCCGSGES